MIVKLIGMIAGLLTVTAALPQLIKTLKTKHTKDISLVMYVVLATGVFLWAIYGFLINDFQIIIANILTFIIVAYILVLKLKYG